MEDSKGKKITLDTEGLTWFKYCYEPGDPKCLCSLCMGPIDEGDCPIRLFDTVNDRSLCLHVKCFQQRSDKNLIKESMKHRIKNKFGVKN